jgi:cell division protein FtsI/penicillin-binding protein 2
MGPLTVRRFKRAAHDRRVLKIVLTSLFLLFSLIPALAQSAHTSQFSQAAQAVLDRNFPNRQISYLLLDASGEVLAERWPSEAPASPGSLVKPFLAVAYGEQHGGQFPTVRCLGTRSRCWLPAGHGSLGLEEAIAQSCNTYFLQLASQLDREEAANIFTRYGLTGPTPTASSESLVGLGAAWKESPMALARAYLMLVKEEPIATQKQIAQGMRSSALRGTARAVDAALGEGAALAKTGTAPCSHTPRAAADGFTVVLYPAAQPRLLLLIRVHGVTGASSAAVAGAMLRSLGAGEGSNKR